ncbi:hypothetical protein ACVRZD_02080 [Streptococcus hongkongensis]|nr:membrane protein [Streptococcus uberis]
MTRNDKKRVESFRQKNAIKTMYYTRYFLVRYVVTFFFFINLYWAVSLYLLHTLASIILPILLGLFAGVAMWEQYQMFTTEQPKAKYSKAFFKTIIAVNGCLGLLTLAGQSRVLFPFFNETFSTRLFIVGILIIGALLSFWMLVKISRIDANKDRQYVRINRYLASLNLSKHY